MTTNIERQGMGKGTGKGDGKPAPLFGAKKGVATNLERTGMGIGMGKGGSQPGLNGRVGGREGKKTRERFLAASLTEGSCRARTCNLRGKGLAFHPLDHRVGEVYETGRCLLV